MHSKLFTGLLVLVLTAVIGTARPAQAQLTLTSNGTALGFSLSTFASGFTASDNIGPLGIAFPTTGGVLVTDYTGQVRLFPTDTDGQNAAAVPVAQNYGNHNPDGLASVGDHIYMTEQAAGNVVEINNDGTLNQDIATGIRSPTGIVGDPINGQLFVSNVNNRILEVNPLTHTRTVLVMGYDIDGLSLSADDTVLYGADDATGHIYGFNATTGAQVFDSGFIPGGVDGTALGYGKLAGDLFINTNGGTVVEVSLTNLFQPTLIADHGSRGDFVTVDPSNGTLLLTQTHTILRLTPGTGGGFGAVPEASSFVSLGLLLLGLGGLTISARRRTRRSAP